MSIDATPNYSINLQLLTFIRAHLCTLIARF